MEYRDYSRTASANNGSYVEGFFPEGMQFSQANDAFREFQSVLARDRKDHNGTIVAGGSTGSYVLSISASLGNYSDGDSFVFTAPVKNAGASTLRVNSLADVPLKRADQSNLADGEIAAGGTYRAWYKSSSASFHLQHLSGVQDRSAVNSALISKGLKHPLSNFPPSFGIVPSRMAAGIRTASEYSSSIMTRDLLLFYPFYVNRPITVSRLSAYVETPGVASFVSFGIYSHSEAGQRPGTRLAAAFGISTAASGTAGGVVSLTLSEGPYWTAWFPYGTTMPVTKAVAAKAMWNWRGFASQPTSITVVGETTLTASLGSSIELTTVTTARPAIFLTYS